jgi:hypothetical protein
MKTLLSLFDYSGTWSAPFAENRWNVIQWDIKLAEFMDLNLVDSAETAFELFDNVDAIIAAFPCTEFAVSGAKHWSAKNPKLLKDAIELVNQVQRLVDLYKPTDPDYDGVFFWGAENPVGRVASVTNLGKPSLYFDPCDYAGYNNISDADLRRLDQIRAKNGHGITKEEADFILSTNTYTKKTCLWGQFNSPEKKRIEPVKGSPFGSVMMRYGGKGAKTKEMRSNTPAGFAEAFYQANKDRIFDFDRDWA